MKGKRSTLFGLLILLSVVLISNPSLAHDDEDLGEEEGQEWIGHAFFALISIFTLLFICYLGAIAGGIVKTPKIFERLNIKFSYKISTLIPE